MAGAGMGGVAARCGGGLTLLPLEGKPVTLPPFTLMGIVNTTPDSFSDGGRFLDLDQAVAHGLSLRAAGADILDIGGESTRPGAATVSVQEELDRTIPVIEALRARTDGLLSIDTRKPQVATEAVAAGAEIWNDVSALTYDPHSVEVAAQLGVQVALMHAQGSPETMQDDPTYTDVVAEVKGALGARINACVAAGIPKDRLIVDPGIGFGKTLAHNIALFHGMRALRALECPILLGASRKRFIAALDRDGPAHERLGGSVAAAVAGYHAGVSWFRVHDVAATRQALTVTQALHPF